MTAPRSNPALWLGDRHNKTVVARLDRAIQYAAASRSIAGVSGILGRPVSPGDDSGVCSGFHQVHGAVLRSLAPFANRDGRVYISRTMMMIRTLHIASVFFLSR
jgi:hypothetical protein